VNAFAWFRTEDLLSTFGKVVALSPPLSTGDRDRERVFAVVADAAHRQWR